MNKKNISKIGTNDVIIASYPGAGSTWFGSLFVSLAIFYVEGYHESLLDNQTQKSVVNENSRRQHLPTLHKRDEQHKSYKEPIRVIKTHLLPHFFEEVFSMNKKQQVILIVRDGRDSVLSYYHWLKAFANYQKTFSEFLNDESYTPATSWAAYCKDWTTQIPSEYLHIVSFEKCRENPVQEISKLLSFLNIQRSIAEIEYAVELSSYSSMKKMEEEKIKTKGDQIGTGKIMRKGKVNGWKDEFQNSDLSAFEGFPNEVLESFAYVSEFS